MTEETLLKFPCEFPIKAVGLAEADFEVLVLTLIRRHIPQLREDAIRSRASKDGKYLALTVTVMAESKEQLDSIYQDLTNHEKVLMAL